MKKKKNTRRKICRIGAKSYINIRVYIKFSIKHRNEIDIKIVDIYVEIEIYVSLEA